MIALALKMLKGTELLLLSLLVALFLPVHLLYEGDNSDDDDNCNLRTAIVEQHLKNFANTNDIIKTVLKEQSLEQLREQVEKITKETAEKERTKCLMIKHNLSQLSNDNTNYFSTLGSIFHINATHKLPFIDAQEYCQLRGMQMAILKTYNQVLQVALQIRKRNIDDGVGFWMSASDIGRTPGQFHWKDGSPVDTSEWAIGHPHYAGAGKEACVYFHTGDAKMRDWRCADNVRILCGLPVTPYACA